jgi:hypothetical protein
MDYLKDKGIRRLQVHDGFQCDKRVNLCELSEVIKMKTGYDVSFVEEQIKFDGEMIACV